jgi:hypothetical protein
LNIHSLSGDLFVDATPTVPALLGNCSDFAISSVQVW